MRLDELKKGFWGYQRESVYRYVVSLEEEASKKLAETEAQSAQKILELEKALKEAQEENAVLRESQMAVSAALLQAQVYAAQMQDETVRQEKEARAEIKRSVDEKLKELEECSAKVGQLREKFRSMIEEMDIKAADLEQNVEETRSKAANLSLFKKNLKIERQEKVS